MKKRIPALVLAFCLLLTLFCMPALADGETGRYVAIGDSIAAGYGLEGFAHISGTAGSLNFTVPEGCFAKLVGAELGYEVNDLAVSGDDTAMLLSRMATEQYAEPLKEADLISVTIGSNDILVTAINALTEQFALASDNHADLTAPGEGSLLGSDLETMKATLQAFNDFLCSEETETLLDAAFETFKTNWNTIMETLQSWNPDAVVLVTNYYNPYSILNFSFGGLTLSIGPTTQKYLDQMNAYIAESGYNGTYYTLVDVTATTTNVKLDMQTLAQAANGAEVDLSGAVNLDPHPDAAGHVYFAAQLLAALPAESAEVSEAAAEEKTPVSFPDVVEKDWFYEAVAFAAERGLVLGDGNGNFCPRDNMSLAQYLTVLYRFARGVGGDTIPEKATTGANWQEAAQYLNTVLMQGKYTDLSAKMTRYEMADITAAALKLISLVGGKTLNTRETHGFADVTDNENVAFLESAYGINGSPRDDGTFLFLGDNNITRAEVATVLMNIITKSLG